MIVSEPPSRSLRAAPSTRFGGWMARTSIPPLSVFPPPGRVMLYALPTRVIESMSITTSCPSSTSRLARSTASSMTAM